MVEQQANLPLLLRGNCALFTTAEHFPQKVPIVPAITVGVLIVCEYSDIIEIVEHRAREKVHDEGAVFALLRGSAEPNQLSAVSFGARWRRSLIAIWRTAPSISDAFGSEITVDRRVLTGAAVARYRG